MSRISVLRVLGCLAVLVGILVVLVVDDILFRRDTVLVGGYVQNDMDGSNQNIAGPGGTVDDVTAYGVEGRTILVESKKHYSPEELSANRGIWPCQYSVIDTQRHKISRAAPASAEERSIQDRLKNHGTVIMVRSCIAH